MDKELNFLVYKTQRINSDFDKQNKKMIESGGNRYE